MATTVVASVQATLSWTANREYDGSLGDLSNTASLQKNLQFANGTGIGQSNAIYSALISLGNSANTTIDLTSLVDVLTANLTLTKAKGVLFYMPSIDDDDTVGSNSTSVLIGNATANQAFTHATDGFFSGTNPAIRVFNGGFHLIGCGNANGTTVSATLKNLKFLNEDAGNTASVYVAILGNK